MLSKALPHTLAVIIFLIFNSIYFAPQLEGKKVKQGDIISALSATKELKDHTEKTGEVSMWTNSMFGGMPAYQISNPQESNKIRHVENLSHLYFPRPIGYFIGAMIFFYIMLVAFGVNPWLSILGALAFGFTTNNLVLFEAGHATKIRSLIFFAPIVMGVIMSYRKRLLAGGIIFSLGMALNLFANHLQMTYYLGLCLLIYILIQLVKDIREKNLMSFVKASLVLLFGLFLAVGSSASRILTTYEYGKDTMRGKPILAKNESIKTNSSSAVKGLDWDYAMSWSNSAMDVMSSIIPGVVGGGSAQPIGKDSRFYTELNKRGNRLGENPKAPLYWGKLPFTSGPNYLGATVVFLFLFGALLVRGKFKWWIVSAIALTVLMSMGKHFGLNRLLFDYLPLLNKFRSPNSVMTVTSFFIPIIGMVALSNILKGEYEKEYILKKLKLATMISGGIVLFFILFGSSMFEFSSAGDARYGAAITEFLMEDRASLMRSDSIRSLLYILVVAGLIWAFVNKKIKQSIFILSIGAAILLDLWAIGKRYLDHDSFVSKRQYEVSFKPRKADLEILKDKTLNYRVFDLSISTFNSSSSSYYHKTIGGYHAGKLQRYQDMIDYYISKGNLGVLNMLNTKYFITKDQQVQLNSQHYGNAWMVSNLKAVNTPNEEIEAVGSIDLRNTAVILSDEFGNYENDFTPGELGTISLTAYAPDELNYKSSGASEQFAVFSEVWYGPNKGWQAYIDNEPVEHVRVNYILRGLKIPAGNHEITFKFEPKNYYLGEKISLICSILIILALLAYLVYANFSKTKKELDTSLLD